MCGQEVACINRQSSSLRRQGCGHERWDTQRLPRTDRAQRSRYDLRSIQSRGELHKHSSDRAIPETPLQCLNTSRLLDSSDVKAEIRDSSRLERSLRQGNTVGDRCRPIAAIESHDPEVRYQPTGITASSDSHLQTTAIGSAGNAHFRHTVTECNKTTADNAEHRRIRCAYKTTDIETAAVRQKCLCIRRE